MESTFGNWRNAMLGLGLTTPTPVCAGLAFALLVRKGERPKNGFGPP